MWCWSGGKDRYECVKWRAPPTVDLCIEYTPITSTSNSHSDLALVPCRLQSRPLPPIYGSRRRSAPQRGGKFLGHRLPSKEKTAVYEIACTHLYTLGSIFSSPNPTHTIAHLGLILPFMHTSRASRSTSFQSRPLFDKTHSMVHMSSNLSLLDVPRVR